MSTDLPDPDSLRGPLQELLTELADFEDNRSNATFAQSSADGKVSAMVDGMGYVVRISIDPSEAALGAVALGEKVRDVVNAAFDSAHASSAAMMSSLASSLALPGLPSFGSAPPDYAGFISTADQLEAQVLANIPCDSTELFECRKGTVLAVVNAKRRVVSLLIDEPLPSYMPNLEARAREAINCAEDGSNDREDEVEDVITDIIDDSPSFPQLCIYAAGCLEIGCNAYIKGEDGTGYGALGNAGDILTKIENGAQTGNVTSRVDVTVDDAAVVHGNALCAGSVTKAPTGTIEGTTTENATVVLPSLSFNVPFPSTAVGTIELGYFQQMTAAPGYYWKLNASSNSQVFLSSGVYYFDHFFMDTGSKLWIDATSGPVIIWVRHSFTYKGSIKDPGGAHPRVFVGYLGSATAYVKTRFKGALAAPQAPIKIYSAFPSCHEASFHGKDIDVKAGTCVCCHHFELNYDDIPGIAPPAGPPPVVADLGFEDISGWSSTQASLSLASSPKTQGASALKIDNVLGLTEVKSANFSSSFAAPDVTRLVVDLWIPSNQPGSATTVGTVSVTLSIPSAGINLLVLGVVGLTGLGQDQFNELEFPLPLNVQQALNEIHHDISLELSLDINGGSGPWYMDDIRALPPVVVPPPTSPLDSILSFEDLSKWSSSQVSLSLATTPKTHLEHALKVVSPPGWTQIESVPFSSATLSAPLAKFYCDLWSSSNQPNPSWSGQFQLAVEVPSLGIFNQWIGQVELTPLPKDTYRLMEISLPPGIAAVFNGNHSDVVLRLILNVTAASGPYYIDHIRFG